MVPGADAVTALEGLLPRVQNAFCHCGQRLAPGIGVVSVNHGTGREDLARRCAAIVPGAQGAHELEIKFTGEKALNPS